MGGILRVVSLLGSLPIESNRLQGKPGEEPQPLASVAHTSPWPLPLQSSDVMSLLGILDTSSPPSIAPLACCHSLGCFEKLLLQSEGG